MDLSQITELQKLVHENSRKHGFYKDIDLIQEILSEEDGINNTKLATYTKNSAIAEKLALIHSELGEALEAVRKDNYNKFNFPDKADISLISKDIMFMSEIFPHEIKDTFEDELADAVIRIFDLAEWMGINLATFIELKHTYNVSRPYKHNKNF